MTSRQRKCLLFIQDHYVRTGRAPTYAAIAAELGEVSRSNAFESVHKLIEAGHLSIERGGLSATIRVIRPIEPIVDVFVFNDKTKQLERYAAQTRRIA